MKSNVQTYCVWTDRILMKGALANMNLLGNFRMKGREHVKNFQKLGGTSTKEKFTEN